MAAELSLSCLNCGRRFPSALRLDEATFQKIRLIEHTESCRHCGFAERFEKADYYFYEVLEGAAGTEGPRAGS